MFENLSVIYKVYSREIKFISVKKHSLYPSNECLSIFLVEGYFSVSFSGFVITYCRPRKNDRSQSDPTAARARSS